MSKNIIDVDEVSNNTTSEENIEIPVLETDFSEFFKVMSLINFADSMDTITLPKHSSNYTDSAKMPLEPLMKELLGFYQQEDEKWRINNNRAVPIVVEDNSIKLPGKTLYDAGRIIIISRLNSICVFPGERSIKDGSFAPNEVIRFINLVATKSFLMQLVDVLNPDEKLHSLKVNFIPIDNIQNENNNPE